MAMGNSKKQNLMIQVILSLALLLLSCRQKEFNKTYISNKHKNMQSTEDKKKFDINKYEENLKKNEFYEGYRRDAHTYVKQYHFIKQGYVEETYNRNLVENYVEEVITDDRYRDIYTFDHDGNLISVKKYFGNGVEIGSWIYYEGDRIDRQENKDVGFSFTLQDVLVYGKKNNVDFLRSGDIKKIQFGPSNSNAWELTWNTGKISADGETYLFRKVILDGKSGKELVSKEYFLNPLIR